MSTETTIPLLQFLTGKLELDPQNFAHLDLLNYALRELPKLHAKLQRGGYPRSPATLLLWMLEMQRSHPGKWMEECQRQLDEFWKLSASRRK